MTLATLFSLYGYVFVLYVLVRRHTALVLLCTVGLMVAVLFAGGAAGLLLPTSKILFWGGIASFGICLGLAARRRISLAGLLNGPELPVLTILATLLLFIFRDANLFYWDEFSHWALAVKEMFGRAALYGANQNMTHAHYPPAASLWLYYTVVNSRFSEPVLYFGQFVFLLAPTFIFYKNVGFRQPHWILAALASQVFLVSVLGHGVVNLLVDHVLSAWFGGILVIYLSDRYRPAELLLFAPPLFTLALIKELGLFLACGAALFIVVHRLFIAPPEAAASVELDKRPVWKQRALLAVLLALLLAGPAGAFSWNRWLAHCTATDVTAAKSSGVSLERVKQAFTVAGQSSDGAQAREAIHRATVKEHFWNVLLHQPLARTAIAYDFYEYNYGMLGLFKDIYRLSAVGWIGFFFVLCAVAYLFAPDKEKRRSVGFTTAFLVALCALYFMMLLYLYSVVSIPEKGEALVSYDRYCNVVIMALVFVALALHFPLWTAGGGSRARRGFAFLVLAGLYWLEPPNYSSLASQPENNFFRKDTAAVVSLVQRKLSQDDKLFVVFPVEENGLFRLMLTYDLAPVRTTISGPDILKKDNAALVALFSRYDYILFLMKAGAVAERIQGFLPGGTTDALYRVHSEDGDVEFEPVK